MAPCGAWVLQSAEHPEVWWQVTCTLGLTSAGCSNDAASSTPLSCLTSDSLAPTLVQRSQTHPFRPAEYRALQT